MHIAKILPHKLPLCTILVVPFVLQIVASVGMVGYLSFRSGQKDINNLANQLNKEITARIVQQLNAHLEIPQEVNQFNEVVFSQNLVNVSGNLNLEEHQALERYLYAQIQATKDLSYIGIGTTTGEYGGAERYSDGAIGYDRAGEITNQEMETFATDQQGNLTKLTAKKPYDPRVRPWYQSALATGKPVWAKIYFYVTASNRLTLSLNQPLKTKQGNLIGVLTADITLSTLSTFLETIKIGKTGQAFIIEPDGLLVATSTGEKPFRLNPAKPREPERLSAKDSENALTVAATNYLLKQFRDLKAIHARQQIIFSWDGNRYFLSVLPFRDNKGLNWLIVVAVPESDFMAQIENNTYKTIWLCLAALVCAIAVGIVTSRRITSRIKRISQASEEIARGDLDQHVNSSRITEIDRLASSFNSMAGQLKDSFETLEVKNEELRLAEENYRGIFENALEGIFQSSPTGQFTRVNPKMARIFGYDSPTEMLASITDIPRQLHVDQQDQETFTGLMGENGQVNNFEYRTYKKDSSIIWVQEDTRAVRDKRGRLLYYEGILQDISDRKRQEAELKRELAQLKIEIDQAKRNKEVARLTETSYFQEVQQEMAQVNLDEFWS